MHVCAYLRHTLSLELTKCLFAFRRHVGQGAGATLLLVVGAQLPLGLLKFVLLGRTDHLNVFLKATRKRFQTLSMEMIGVLRDHS